MRIRDLTIGEGAWLAPMAGITDAVFRMLCREQGCALLCTEMISAKGLMMSPPGTRQVRELLDVIPGAPTAAQLFGSEPAYMALAARRLSELGRFALLDINMGCPAHKIVGGGDGSALLRDLPLARSVIAAVRGATDLPVTIKMRLGWDDDRPFLELARIAEGEGVDAIALHARTRTQQYAGVADWDAIAALKRAVRVPVIGNGDVTDEHGARAMIAHTGCDAVMVGRAAQGNPWVFARIRDALLGREPTEPPTVADRIACALRHAGMMAAWKGEAIAMREMRKHFAWYLKGFRGSAEARRRCNAALTLREAEDILCEAANREGEDPA